MKLPNGDRAYIGDKLERYIFNAEHDIGKHKARGFGVVLGITGNDKSLLVAALLQHASDSDDAVELGDLGFGPRYRLDFEVRTSGGGAVVRSGWIIRTGEEFPRLTTCFILHPL